MLKKIFTDTSNAVSRKIANEHPKFPISEPGLTSEIASRIFREAQGKALLVPRPDENITGADLDLHLVDGGRVLSLRLQAKRQYCSGLSLGTYRALNKAQLKRLLAECPATYTPLYLFYTGRPQKFEWEVERAEGAGCTLSPAKAVKKLLFDGKRPNRTVKAHLPNAFPWERLFFGYNHADPLTFAWSVLNRHHKKLGLTTSDVADVRLLPRELSAMIQEQSGMSSKYESDDDIGAMRYLMALPLRTATEEYFDNNPSVQAVLFVRVTNSDKI